jgi:hypothetical protein
MNSGHWGKPAIGQWSFVIGKGKETTAATKNPHDVNARNGFPNDQ